MNWTCNLVCFGVSLGSLTAPAAEFRTANFSVTAESLDVARKVAGEAEKSRKVLAEGWLSRPLDDWTFRCRINVKPQGSGGSGRTSYRLLAGDVTKIGIHLEGPPERILEFVLPHELTHAILVSALGEALPRWADEGAAMLAESPSQRHRQRLLAAQLVQAGTALGLREVFSLEEYPSSQYRLRAFYAESLTLAEFLIERGGRKRFLQFVRQGEREGWDDAIRRHYDFKDAEALEAAWREWVPRAANNAVATSQAEEIERRRTKKATPGESRVLDFPGVGD